MQASTLQIRIALCLTGFFLLVLLGNNLRWDLKPGSHLYGDPTEQCLLAAEGSILYTNLGATFAYQPYIWVSIAQARVFNPCTTIYLICSSEALEDPDILKEINLYHVTVVDYGSLSHKVLDDFRANFFVQGSMVPDGNEKFNQFTSERLLAVWLVMQQLDLRDVIHLENDNMIYSPISELIAAMHLCDVHLAVPFPTIRQAVVGIAYIRTSVSLVPFIQFTIRVFQMGQQKAVERLGTEFINDMSLLGTFYQEQSGSELVSELPTKIYNFRSHTEDQNVEESFLWPVKFRENHTHNCIAEALPGAIFDGCVLGQYFGGRFGEPSIPYWHESRQFDPRGQQLWWQVKSTASFKVRVPYMGNVRILNLHVHSKRLDLFTSDIAD